MRSFQPPDGNAKTATVARALGVARQAPPAAPGIGLQHRLLGKLAREPLSHEIAAETGLEAGRVNDLLRLIEQPVSLDAPIGEGDSLFRDTIEDTHTERPETATLPTRLRCVLELGYGLLDDRPRSLDALGRTARSHPRNASGSSNPGAFDELKTRASARHHYLTE